MLDNIEARISEAREKGLRASTEAEQREARLELADLLAEQREAAGDVVSADAGESKAMRRLRGRTAVGKFLAAGLRGAAVSGAEAELAQEARAERGEIPYAAFTPPPRSFRAADAPTAAPTSGTGVTAAPLVPTAFADSLAEFLGVEMPMVPSGAYSVPRFKSSLAAAAKGKADAIESTAATFEAVTVSPEKRITARLSLSEHDLSAVGIPAFEASLEQNLRQVLADALDLQLLRGSGTAPNLKSIVSQTTAAADPSAEVTLASAASTLAALIDGKFAPALSDLRAVVNPSVMAKLAATFASSDDSVSVLEWIKRQGVMIRSNSNMAASAANIGAGLVVRAGMPMGAMGAAAVCPVWRNLSIRDPYSDSGAVQTHITLAAIVGDVVIRYPESYASWKVKTA